MRRKVSRTVHPLRNILSKLRWKSSELSERYLITYRHRGAVNDVKQIRATDIVKLGKSYFTLNSEAGEEVTIPFHRILEIRDVEKDAMIWKSRKQS